MDICDYCGKEMLDNIGCSCEKIEFGPAIYNRIKAGDKNDWVRPGEICHDCGAPHGTYHHYGCDAERCPKCGGQLISCECEVPRRIIPPHESKCTRIYYKTRLPLYLYLSARKKRFMKKPPESEVR